MIVMNPPYGERISTPNLLGTYKMIGERLKHHSWVMRLGFYLIVRNVSVRLD